MELNWLRIADRLQRFKNRHKGEEMVLICNGPSLNRTNFNLIRKRHIMGLNKIFLGFNKFKIYPKYYVAVNQKVIEQSKEQIEKLNCIKFMPPQEDRSILNESALSYWIKADLPPMGFSTDLALGVHQGWTVTHVGLQIAYYMGFDRVVIVGMDHRYRFQGIPNELEVLNGPDPNHFTEGYFQDCAWNNPDLRQSEEAYRIARYTYEAAGRAIIDCTIEGACEVFEKRSLEEVLQ